MFVLDRFHRNKYINDSVSHMLDSKSDAWNQITEMVSGAEGISCSQMLSSDRNRGGQLGKYTELFTHSISSPQIKKIVAMKSHIWGL